jgi:hypothetical protein
LNHERDLMAMESNGVNGPSTPSHGIYMRHTIVILSILVLLPLILFTTVSGFFTRIFILLVVGFAGAVMASSVGLVDNVLSQDLATSVLL